VIAGLLMAVTVAVITAPLARRLFGRTSDRLDRLDRAA
jgi:hypothetical protein